MAKGYVVILNTTIVCNKCGEITKEVGYYRASMKTCNGCTSGGNYHTNYTILYHEYYVYEQPADLDPDLIANSLDPSLEE